jgi:hypothetical protein
MVVTGTTAIFQILNLLKSIKIWNKTDAAPVIRYAEVALNMAGSLC